jgi:hypothetical protein
VAAAADASFMLPRAMLDEVIAKQTSFPVAKITFTAMRLAELMALMDEFPRTIRNRRAEADGGELGAALEPSLRANSRRQRVARMRAR